MAVMRRELPSGTVRMREHRPSMWNHPLLTALLGAIAVLIAYQLLAGAMFWARVKVDDLRYGYPRSYQLDGFVGFGESNGTPTHFVALNLHRQIVVLVTSGDDPSHTITLKGPYLFGSDEEYSPVTLRLVDVNGDGYPDVVLGVDHQQVVWIDQPRQGSFRPISPQERMAATQVLGGAP